MATPVNAPPSAWFIAGATATGKSAVAQQLAEQNGCAILSADAMLVYRGMDIGTAKPPPSERGGVPYFGIDLVSAAEPFSTGLWLADACRALRSAPRAGLIVAGGTGLYLKALTDGLDGTASDPDARARWQALYAAEGLDALRRALEARAPGALETLPDPANPRRLIRALEHLDARGTLPDHWRRTADAPPIPALRLPREQLHARIVRRVDAMFAAGLIDEVRTLQRDIPVWSETAGHAIGYAEVRALLAGELTQSQAAERIAARTRQLAKRQETWLRHQAHVVWIDITDDAPPDAVARRVTETWRLYGPSPVVLP